MTRRLRLHPVGDDLETVLKGAEFHGIADDLVVLVNDEKILQVLIRSHRLGVHQDRLVCGGWLARGRPQNCSG